jgi:hypothetical protein
MSKKSTKTFIKHCNACFQRVKWPVNGFEFFWKWHFWQSSQHKPNKIVWNYIYFYLFEYLKNNIHKIF